jgi:hypothetical protein
MNETKDTKSKLACTCKQCIHCERYVENYYGTENIVCIQCSEDEYGTRCRVCGKPIFTSNPIKSKKTHEECIAIMNLSLLQKRELEWYNQVRFW